MMPTNINLRERPTIKDLCLSKIDVPSLMTFREKFIRMVNNYTPEEFCMVHYLSLIHISEPTRPY